MLPASSKTRSATKTWSRLLSLRSRAVDEPLAVRREERPAVVAGRVREAHDVRCRRRDRVELQVLVDGRWVGLRLRRRAAARGSLCAVRREDDPLAVRRVRALGVVGVVVSSAASSPGQPPRPAPALIAVLPVVGADRSPCPAGTPSGSRGPRAGSRPAARSGSSLPAVEAKMSERAVGREVAARVARCRRD